MKNKKGFLLGEFALKIIIGVMSLALLLFLLFTLYAIFTSNIDIEQATSSLDKIEEGLNIAAIEGSYEYLFYEPKGWGIFYFKQAIVLDCLGNCLCVCKDEKSCSEKKEAVCRGTEKEISIPKEITSDPPVEIIIKKEGTNYIIKKK